MSGTRPPARVRLADRVERTSDPEDRRPAPPHPGPRPAPRRRVSWGLTAIIAAWAIGVVVGMGSLMDYSFEAGVPADAPATWPPDSALPLGTERPTLLMVVHPRCSCTRASIRELDRLMTRLQGAVDARVLFVRPQGVDRDWPQTDLWRSVERIPGVTVVDDDQGTEAARLGARTSGQVYLYGIDGRLMFAGGITPSRSHEGDSVGRRRLLELIASGTTDRDDSAVFGCSLADEDAAEFRLPAWRGG